MQELFKIMPNALRDEGKSDQLRETLVMAAFRRVAGESLRGHAVPFRLFQRQLIVAVADENWKRNLENLAGQLLFKTNAAVGEAVVTYIEFRIDTELIDAERDKIWRESQSQLEKDRSAMAHVPPSVLKAAEAIEDENLRKHFLLAAGSCIERRKVLK